MSSTDEAWHSGVFAGTTYRYYTSKPTNSKPWLILFHGHPGCTHCWHRTVPFLQNQGYGIIIPDMLGYGGTDKPIDVQAYRASKVVESMDALIATVIENEEEKRVVAIGHDWGSTTAARLHLRKPARVEAIVLVSLAYLPPSSEPFDFAAFNALFRPHVGYDIIDYFKFFSSEEAPALLTEKIDSFLTIAFAKNTPELWRERWASGTGMQEALKADMRFEIADYMTTEDLDIYRRMLADGHYAARLNWYKSFYLGIQQEDDQDLLGERAYIRVPTLFFQGLRDAVCIPPTAAFQPNYIADLTTVDLDADHFIMEGERGEEFNKALHSWLESKGL